MAQPKLSIPRESLDHFLTGVAGGCLLLIFGVIMYYYDLLPEQIPSHFNLQGEPDRYGQKSTLWVLFAVGVALFLLLEYFTRQPHLGNYSIPITEENAPRQYRNMQRMTRTLNAVISLFFAYLIYGIIQTAMNNRDGLSMWISLLFVAVITVLIVYSLYRAKVMER